MNIFSVFLESFSSFFSADPSILLVQSLMVAAAFLIIFLVLFSMRDILLRTHSFAYQIFCILIVAAFPIVGFCVYLLIRPSTTLRERALEHKLNAVLAVLNARQQKQEKKK